MAKINQTAGKSKSPIFSKGQDVFYTDSSKNIYPAKILSVHQDDDLVDYYTILLPEGREKQTDLLHLSAVDSVSGSSNLSTNQNLIMHKWSLSNMVPWLITEKSQPQIAQPQQQYSLGQQDVTLHSTQNSQMTAQSQRAQMVHNQPHQKQIQMQPNLASVQNYPQNMPSQFHQVNTLQPQQIQPQHMAMQNQSRQMQSQPQHMAMQNQSQQVQSQPQQIQLQPQQVSMIQNNMNQTQPRQMNMIQSNHQLEVTVASSAQATPNQNGASFSIGSNHQEVKEVNKSGKRQKSTRICNTSVLYQPRRTQSYRAARNAKMLAKLYGSSSSSSSKSNKNSMHARQQQRKGSFTTRNRDITKLIIADVNTCATATANKIS